MGFRFSRRIKIAPGLYLNASTRGLGVSVGVRGASVSINSRGAYANVGIPGTGISYRQKISGTPASAPRARAIPPAQQAYFHANPPTVHVAPQSQSVDLRDASGQPLPQDLRDAAWSSLSSEIDSATDNVLQGQAEQIDRFTNIHRLTPSPNSRSSFVPKAFDEAEPSIPPAQTYHWFFGLFPPHRRRIDAQNQAIQQDFNSVRSDWASRKMQHEKLQNAKKEMFRIRDTGSPTAIAGFLEWHLEHLEWPRETSIDFDLSSDGKTAFFDVDLPEIEDLPQGSHSRSGRSRELKWTALSDTAKRKLYMNHVHGIGLRIAGEAFSHGPDIQTVVISGYSQRRSRETAAIEDEYLYSSKINRSTWQLLDFSHLEHLDPVAAFDRFETRRQMTATGVFRPVCPFPSTL